MQGLIVEHIDDAHHANGRMLLESYAPAPVVRAGVMLASASPYRSSASPRRSRFDERGSAFRSHPHQGRSAPRVLQRRGARGPAGIDRVGADDYHHSAPERL